MIEQQPWLIVGLGNPGGKYARNFHNAGFMALEILSQRHHIAVDRIKFKGLYGQGQIAGQKVILLKPATFMNLSGESLQEAMAFFKIPPERILVLYDDLDIAIGEVRMRPNGGPGTHNGMRSIAQHLGGGQFPRVRVGIGPLPPHWELVNYVLSDIPQGQQESFWQALNKAADAVEMTLRSGLEAAMNQVNRREKPRKPARPEATNLPADAAATTDALPSSNLPAAADNKET
jgi:PTH1 family peptidyl-tRNA hydrolase